MAIDFENNVVAGVVLIRDSIQSQNFGVDDQGQVTGWQINSDGSSSFTSTTIGGANWGIDNEGVGSFSSVNVDDDLILDGTSLVESLDAVPDGLVAYGDSSIYNNGVPTQWSVNTAASGSASVAGAGAVINAAEFDMADWRADRYYLILLSFTVIATTANMMGRYTIRYTTDGTTPGVGSGILDGAEIYSDTGANAPFQARITFSVIYSPSVSYDLLRFALTFGKQSTPVGLLSIELNDPNSKLQWSILDIGPQAIAIAGGSLSQKSKSAGTPDPDPPSTYTKTYSATWSRGWNDSGNDIYSTNGELVQGQSPATSSYGNRISWIGFDFSAIQSALSGATVKKVEVFLYFNHWYNNSGGTAVIGTHKSTATSAPSYNASLDNQDRQRVANWAANSGKWVNITSAVGTDFKTGNATGIVIGRGASTSQLYYGKAQGNTQSNEPKLRITYTK